MFSHTNTLVVLSAICGVALIGCGSDKIPSSPSSSSVSPAYAFTNITVTPSSVTLKVGQSQVFVAAGGDGYNYVWDPVQPASCFATDILFPGNQMRVTMTCKPPVSSAKVTVLGIGPGGAPLTVSATVYVGG
jgi:hypothetical protein